jgi:HTH-type transcriptional regulator/antitoxin HipB
MGWCSLLLTPEVRAWLTALDDDDFGRVAFYLDLLRSAGASFKRRTAGACPDGFTGWRSPDGGACTSLPTTPTVTARSCCSRSGGDGGAPTTSSSGPPAQSAADEAPTPAGPKGAAMSRRNRWDELRQDKLASPAASAGYERARRAFELGEQLRALREAQQLSQSELARRMGSTQPAIARLEAGRVAPSLDTLDRAAAALGVELVVTFQQPQRRDRRQLSG